MGARPAARLTDSAGHSGPISTGAPTVLINSLPAARVGDQFLCLGLEEAKPHVSGSIVEGSKTVMIDGAFAARRNDPTQCIVMGASSRGRALKKGPSFVRTGTVYGRVGGKKGFLVSEEGEEAGNNSKGLLWGQSKTYLNENGDGPMAMDRTEWEGSIFHDSYDQETELGRNAGSLDIGNVVIEESSSGMSAEVSALKLTESRGTPRGDPLYVGFDGTVKVLTAKVQADVLMGSDGRRTGFAFDLGAEAHLVTAELDGTVERRIPIEITIPFTDFVIWDSGYSLDIGVTAGVSGSVGDLGASVNGGVFYDRADDRVHATAGASLGEVLFGEGVSIDIFAGLVSDEDSSPPVPIAIPGVIICGSPTVLIG